MWPLCAIVTLRNYSLVNNNINAFILLIIKIAINIVS